LKRNKLERKEITAEQLREIEDGAIRRAVKRQEEIGLPAVPMNSAVAAGNGFPVPHRWRCLAALS
jgi:methionine synthase II (cobalamin-independent)